jgi:hypothetical protein
MSDSHDSRARQRKDHMNAASPLLYIPVINHHLPCRPRPRPLPSFRTKFRLLSATPDLSATVWLRGNQSAGPPTEPPFALSRRPWGFFCLGNYGFAGRCSCAEADTQAQRESAARDRHILCTPLKKIGFLLPSPPTDFFESFFLLPAAAVHVVHARFLCGLYQCRL